jgi:hypothetical protein
LPVNAQYNLAAPESLPIKIAAYQRRRMYKRFLSTTGIREEHTVLDVGVTSDQTYSHSNYLVQWYPYKDRITACGIDDAAFLEELYPGLKFVRTNGKELPFSDGQFDYIHSSAVLEHVGSREAQAAFLRECWRVARRGVFITTPNRWFPIEFHTLLPIAHWLPPALFRRICRLTGREFFADEEKLNLISRSQLKQIASAAGMTGVQFDCVKLGGWPSNLLLWAHRQAAADPSQQCC